MARKKKPADPLTHIPSAKVVREQLQETRTKAKQLEILLDVAERIEAEQTAETEAPCK